MTFTPDFRAPYFRQDWVRVQNSSSSNGVIPPHSVVLITGCSSSDGEPVFSVTKPNNSSTEFNFDGYLVTGPKAIAGIAGAEGEATPLTKAGYVAYSGGTPTTGTIYGPKHNQYTLQQYYYGYLILGGATTSCGVNVVAARWVGIPSVLGKTDASISIGGSPITVSVWAGAAGSEADTTMNITGVGSPFTAVGSGKFVWVGLNGGIPYITQSQKTLHTAISDFRIKSGDTYIEAEDLEIYVDSIDTLEYHDKIPLDDCTP